jgi:type VI secretion system secreted protein VgrG
MSLSQTILAALSGAPTQTERMLVLHTPLGRDVLVAERAEIVESIGPGASADDAAGAVIGFSIVVDALAADTHLELKQLIGQPALLELLTAASRTALRPFHGQITRASLLGSDGGLARYRLTIEPWLGFLAHRQDAWVFQQRTVIEIVEEVFADYQSQGKLAPAWRWDLADAAVYPQRSLSIQYHESDLQFITRLLREEGLFFWFEHLGQADDAGLGAHTLVIADHNNAFKPGAQPVVRFTQSAAVQPEDSLTRWRERAATHTATLDLASLDHRSLSLRPQSQSADAAAGTAPHPELGLTDIPGAYAYEDSAQGARLALRQMQAIDALRAQVQARGTLRSSAPGTTFTLTDHAQHDGRDDARDRFVMLSVRHTARNNLSADQRAQVQGVGIAIAQINTRIEAGHTAHHLFGQAPARNASGAANASDEPLYQCSITAQRAAVPVRLGALDDRGLPDPRIHPRPSVQGVQTAIVVGTAGQPIHTDRDQRIKVQFHWQRGANASHRLDHPSSTNAGDNAPASDASGTWVRVSQSVAGTNWGAVFTPRLGQEVLVQFINGDIDRPVVIGAAYNGQGSADAQGNRNAAGAASATGNAQAWFPGTKKQGELQAHAHPAVFAGHKSQELASSQGGSGGYNQLVFDDSAAAGRIELASTSAQTRLQLGHLLNQNDNQRLQARGHGLDLSTAAWGVVRAGSGILVSAHAKTGSQSVTRSLDSREPQTQIEQSQQLLHSLAESAQQHKAKSTDEPDVIGAKKADKARQLSNEQALYAATDSLSATDKRGQGAQGEGSTGGGTGDITAWSRPDLVIAAPAGIAAFTPATGIFAAGSAFTMVAGQDLQHVTQGNHATAVKNGLSLFTYGQASEASKPNQETGIKLHAASGNVRLEAQSEAVKITADKAVEVASTNGMVKITAPNHILLTAAGAALDIQAGSITLKGPGMIEFRASMKNLTGPGTASQSVLNFPRGELDIKKTAVYPISL